MVEKIMGIRTKRRWTVLFELLNSKKIKPKIGAEIGIQRGVMSIKVLNKLPSLKTYYAIDPWLWYPSYKEGVNERNQERWNQEVMDEYFKEFKKGIQSWKKKVNILRMLSSEAHVHIPDGSLEFCFIDGNHAYEYIKEDIQLYLPKIRKGGLFGGHDYGHVKGGVKEAVDETFNESQIYLGSNKTWWIWT
jgi:hypothetical protein